MIKKVWNWMGKNDRQIQALMIIVLVSVTLYYAIYTNIMASTMKKEFESNNKPSIFVSNLTIARETSSINLMLENSGNHPAGIRLLSADVIFYKLPDETIGRKDLAKGFNFTRYIFPNQNAIIPLPASDIIANITESDGFFLTIQFEYFDVNNPKNKKNYFAVINYYTGKNNTNGFIWDMEIFHAD